ncbi:MAG: response regulator [Deltaproteobacteria bacterium]|nr:response regulator [Deltaproteobacteria bacterium]
MANPLRVLIAEDREGDVDLVVLALRWGGFEPEVQRVETAGAHDFMSEGNLTRLVPVVEREIHDTALRKERRTLEGQLVISDRMASVGSLAAGVAHEINNPLGALMANLQFAMEDLARVVDDSQTHPSDDAWRDWLARRIGEALEPLRDARESSERIRNIAKDLKVFARSNDGERPGPVDVRRVVESSARMAWVEIRHRARLVNDFAEVPPVQATEGRLGQVVLNLIVNAAQAIPEDRTDKNEIRIRIGMADGKRVFIEVRDTGTGIAPENLPRIFDAFFTTKPAGVGTGLGLAICHRIVTTLGGEITVHSELEHGTTFRLALPISTDVAPAAPIVDVRTAPPSRRGRVLIVDDEPTMCAALRRMLAGAHDVVTVPSGSKALERLTAGEVFDVILCDLMMPEMTGMELHGEVTRRLPEVAGCFIFMTGAAVTSSAREFLDRVPNSHLEKPFNAARLRALINDRVR